MRKQASSALALSLLAAGANQIAAATVASCGAAGYAVTATVVTSTINAPSPRSTSSRTN